MGMYFMIPALLGGRQDMMLANLVDFYTRQTLDWNMAARSASSCSAVGTLVGGTARSSRITRTREDICGGRIRSCRSTRAPLVLAATALARPACTLYSSSFPSLIVIPISFSAARRHELPAEGVFSLHLYREFFTTIIVDGGRCSEPEDRDITCVLVDLSPVPAAYALARIRFPRKQLVMSD